MSARPCPPDDANRLVETTTRLREQTEAPDSAEGLAAIPTLRLADIERAVPHTPTVIRTVAGTTVLTHELATNGVVYIDLALDLGTLPADLLPWVKLVATALFETGADNRDFVTPSQDIGRLTGGITHEVIALTETGTGRAQCRLALRGKATPERTGDLTGLLHDILTTPRFGDRERIRQIVLKHKASMSRGSCRPAPSSRAPGWPQACTLRDLPRN